MPMNNTKKTLLITGSQGFTASYLREVFLKDGYTVWGLAQQTPREWEVCADLTQRESLRQVIAQIRPDYVIHLAGISNVVHENSEALYQINCQGTLNLLSVLQTEKIPVKKIILASSAYVYGNYDNPTNLSTSLISEKTCPKPINHYAMSKLAMEYMAASLYENLPIVIARPFNYTGAGQQDYILVPKILHHFITQAPKISLGNTHVYREFNDVRMVVEAYRGLLHHAEPGTTVNICTGKSHCLKEILDLCHIISGHHLEVVIDPHLVRKNEAVHLSGDPTLLRSILPNLPIYTLEETLRWMFDQN
jgi:nucleoside-diphosphate-sugar epimerase